MSFQKYQLKTAVVLENGTTLHNPTIAYHTYGQLKADKSNVIWVCHALTGSSDVFDWWPGLFGANDLFNPEEHFIVCANMLGSHYGSTNPLSIDPTTNKPYYHSFPNITIRDMVNMHRRLASHLQIDQIELLLGGSMGGHQALEWAIMEPDKINSLCLLATSAEHSPWGVAFNASQRMAIANDATWPEQRDSAGLEGMKVARAMALLSYRNYTTYQRTQAASDAEEIYPSRPESYQRYQGEKLAQRFNAFSYWYLSKAMDSQNVGRGRGGLMHALSRITARTLVISIQDDVLFPLADQQLLVAGIPNAQHKIIPSDYGHDGFLVEVEKISEQLMGFLSEVMMAQE